MAIRLWTGSAGDNDFSNPNNWNQEGELQPDFLEWLNEALPDWDAEYSGTIALIERAWRAGASNKYRCNLCGGLVSFDGTPPGAPDGKKSNVMENSSPKDSKDLPTL